MKTQSSIIHSFFNGLLLLALFGCVGSGGDPTGGSGGGPVGAAPDAGSEFSAGLNAPGSVGSVTTSAASPEMPDVPVAPNLDIEDNGQKFSEYRIEGKITSICQEAGGSKIRKKIEGQLFCRWKGSQDSFTICGSGRYLRIVDTVTHFYLDAQASEDESRFDFEFKFNVSDQVLSPQPEWKKTLLFAAITPKRAYETDAVLRESSQGAFRETPILQNPDEVNVPLPYDPGPKYDSEDQNKFSDPSNLIVYVHTLGFQTNELGIQKFCISKINCEQVSNGFIIHLGPITFLIEADGEVNSAENIPECDS